MESGLFHRRSRADCAHRNNLYQPAAVEEGKQNIRRSRRSAGEGEEQAKAAAFEAGVQNKGRGGVLFMLFLLLRAGRDFDAVGVELYGVAQRLFGGEGGDVCQPFLHRHNRRQRVKRIPHFQILRQNSHKGRLFDNMCGCSAHFGAFRRRPYDSRLYNSGARLRARVSEHNSLHAVPFRRGKFAGNDRNADGVRLYRRSCLAAVRSACRRN